MSRTACVSSRGRKRPSVQLSTLASQTRLTCRGTHVSAHVVVGWLFASANALSFKWGSLRLFFSLSSLVFRRPKFAE